MLGKKRQIQYFFTAKQAWRRNGGLTLFFLSSPVPFPELAKLRSYHFFVTHFRLAECWRKKGASYAVSMSKIKCGLKNPHFFSLSTTSSLWSGRNRKEEDKLLLAEARKISPPYEILHRESSMALVLRKTPGGMEIFFCDFAYVKSCFA